MADDWYVRTADRISSYQSILSKKDFKKYRLDLLLRIAKRVDDFSPECEECRKFKDEISTLVNEIGSMPVVSKEQHRAYNRSIDTMVKHLKKKHKLVSEGENMAMWVSIGTGLGVALGPLFENIALGIPIGVAIGIAIGSALDYKAKKDGKAL